MGTSFSWNKYQMMQIFTVSPRLLADIMAIAKTWKYFADLLGIDSFQLFHRLPW